MSRSMSNCLTILRRTLGVAAALVLLSGPALAQNQPPEPQDEFVPVGNSPAPEQIPAAPLLIGAYVVVLGGLFAYVVSLSRRLGAVQRDVQRLESDVQRRTRS
jgi:hypothetical protein